MFQSRSPHYLLSLLTWALLTLCPSLAVRAQTLGPELILNGDFATGTLANWTNLGDTVVVNDPPRTNVASLGNATLTSNSFSLIVGARYQISYFIRHVLGVPPGNIFTAHLTQTGGGVTNTNLQLLVNQDDTAYVQVTRTVTAARTSGVITFTASGAGSYRIDNLSVRQIVPEIHGATALLPLLSLGLILLILNDRRRLAWAR